MNKALRALAPTGVMVALGAALASANAQSMNGLLVLKMSGARGWTIECAFERQDDDPISKRAVGRGDVETFAVSNAIGGSCDYAGPRRGSLQIRFRDENFPEKCPFTVRNGECLGRFAAGAEGSFSF